MSEKVTEVRVLVAGLCGKLRTKYGVSEEEAAKIRATAIAHDPRTGEEGFALDLLGEFHGALTTERAITHIKDMLAQLTLRAEEAQKRDAGINRLLRELRQMREDAT